MENFITQISQRLNKEGVKTSESVKISEDGSTLICGYPDEECAIIFTKQDRGWVIQQKLTASDGQANDNFGHIVSISTDGTSAKIYTQGGREYTFTIVDGTWVETNPPQPNRKPTMKLSNLENKAPNVNGLRAYLNNVEVQNIETSTVNPEVDDPFTLVTINTVHVEAFEFLDQDLELAKRAIPGTMVYHIEDRHNIPYRLVVTVERTATEEEFLEA